MEAKRGVTVKAFGPFRRPRPALPQNSVEHIPGARGPVTSRQAAEWVRADALGRWAYHCHLFFHMESGMFREVRVEE